MTDEFWKEINRSQATAKSIDEQLEMLRGYLQRAGDAQVQAFQQSLIEALNQSNRFTLAWGFCGVVPRDGWTGEMSFHYYCCWLVLQGKDVFVNIVANPDLLSNYDDVVPCSELFDLAIDEWQRRHGKPLQSKLQFGDQSDEPKTVEEYRKFLFDDLKSIYPVLSQTSETLMELAWHPTDRHLMHKLRYDGVCLRDAREVDHFFFCNEVEAVSVLRQQLEDKGHKIEEVDMEMVDGKEAYIVHSIENTSPVELTRRTQSLLDLADELGAHYNGWGVSCEVKAPIGIP
ncbi:MAG: DUF4240 domain-containing protein [Candidatus Obscuribacterales bacterium]|nr:DUF4240 domain-containing protein [Candidatus Obscuribacterales bacterium]